jgi:hypothetical protein
VQQKKGWCRSSGREIHLKNTTFNWNHGGFQEAFVKSQVVSNQGWTCQLSFKKGGSWHHQSASFMESSGWGDWGVHQIHPTPQRRSDCRRSSSFAPWILGATVRLSGDYITRAAELSVPNLTVYPIVSH